MKVASCNVKPLHRTAGFLESLNVKKSTSPSILFSFQVTICNLFFSIKNEFDVCFLVKNVVISCFF